MALGFSIPCSPSLPLSTFFTSSFSLPLCSLPPSHLDGLHVVGGQHALLAGAGHAAVHPALVDLLHVHNLVSVHEGHLIVVGSGVVVDGPVALLRGKQQNLLSRAASGPRPRAPRFLFLWDIPNTKAGQSTDFSRE